MRKYIDLFETFVSSWPWIAVFVSAGIGYVTMPIVLRIAKKYKWVVVPNKRTSHHGEIPFVGGLNIFISFVTASFILMSGLLNSKIHFSMLGVFMMLMLGFIDDLIDVRASHKLLGEILAGFCLIVLADIRIKSLHGFLGIYEINLIVSYLLSLFVYIGLVNAINLIDGIDGLASGLGIIYSSFFAVYFQLTNNVGISIFAYVLVGSLLIFFFYNVYSKRKKLFMGDSGSLLLGYMVVLFIFRFSEFNINNTDSQYHLANVPTILLSLLILPVFDTLRVMVLRIKKGISPFEADRNHIHHMLIDLGLKHIHASAILILFTALFTTLGLILRNCSVLLGVLVILLLAMILTFNLYRVVKKKK